MSDPNPSAATRFLAVLGQHAIALSQGEAEDGVLHSSKSKDKDEESFHAARLRSVKRELSLGKMSLANYETMFTTGNQLLDDQLGALVDALTAREREGKEPWKRGESVVLMEGRRDRDLGKPWTWTVWDAGYAPTF